MDLNELLVQALGKGFWDQALTLVEAGADPNTEMAFSPGLKGLRQRFLRFPSYTAFMFACSSRTTLSEPSISSEEDLPLLEAMLQRGAELDRLTINRRTILHLTIGTGRLKSMDLVLRYGADANAQDEHGYTTLMLCHWEDTTEMAEILLSYGADPRIPNGNGDTALHFAVGSPLAEAMVPLLLAKGADPHAANRIGETPISVAEEYELRDVLALLKRSEGDRPAS